MPASRQVCADGLVSATRPGDRIHTGAHGSPAGVGSHDRPIDCRDPHGAGAPSQGRGGPRPSGALWAPARHPGGDSSPSPRPGAPTHPAGPRRIPPLGRSTQTEYPRPRRARGCPQQTAGPGGSAPPHRHADCRSSPAHAAGAVARPARIPPHPPGLDTPHGRALSVALLGHPSSSIGLPVSGCSALTRASRTISSWAIRSGACRWAEAYTPRRLTANTAHNTASGPVSWCWRRQASLRATPGQRRPSLFLQCRVPSVSRDVLPAADGVLLALRADGRGLERPQWACRFAHGSNDAAWAHCGRDAGRFRRPHTLVQGSTALLHVCTLPSTSAVSLVITGHLLRSSYHAFLGVHFY